MYSRFSSRTALYYCQIGEIAVKVISKYSVYFVTVKNIALDAPIGKI